jgi:hypothetical protein
LPSATLLLLPSLSQSARCLCDELCVANMLARWQGRPRGVVENRDCVLKRI